MSWLLKKLDMLIGAGFAATVGMCASQVQSFIDQYLQRLGGHLDEATMNLDRIQTGVRYQTMSETVRQELEADAAARVEELKTSYDAISSAGVFEQPWSFFKYADDAIVSRAWVDFVPAVPLDTHALIYIGVGIVVALGVYELVKLPLVVIFGQPRPRKFKKRGQAA